MSWDNTDLYDSRIQDAIYANYTVDNLEKRTSELLVSDPELFSSVEVKPITTAEMKEASTSTISGGNKEKSIPAKFAEIFTKFFTVTIPSVINFIFSKFLDSFNCTVNFLQSLFGREKPTDDDQSGSQANLLKRTIMPEIREQKIDGGDSNNLPPPPVGDGTVPPAPPLAESATVGNVPPPPQPLNTGDQWEANSHVNKK